MVKVPPSGKKAPPKRPPPVLPTATAESTEPPAPKASVLETAPRPVPPKTTSVLSPEVAETLGAKSASSATTVAKKARSTAPTAQVDLTRRRDLDIQSATFAQNCAKYRLYFQLYFDYIAVEESISTGWSGHEPIKVEWLGIEVQAPVDWDMVPTHWREILTSRNICTPDTWNILVMSGVASLIMDAGLWLFATMIAVRSSRAGEQSARVDALETIAGLHTNTFRMDYAPIPEGLAHQVLAYWPDFFNAVTWAVEKYEEEAAVFGEIINSQNLQEKMLELQPTDIAIMIQECCQERNVKIHPSLLAFDKFREVRHCLERENWNYEAAYHMLSDPEFAPDHVPDQTPIRRVHILEWFDAVQPPAPAESEAGEDPEELDGIPPSEDTTPQSARAEEFPMLPHRQAAIVPSSMALVRDLLKGPIDGEGCDLDTGRYSRDKDFRFLDDRATKKVHRAAERNRYLQYDSHVQQLTREFLANPGTLDEKLRRWCELAFPIRTDFRMATGGTQQTLMASSGQLSVFCANFGNLQRTCVDPTTGREVPQCRNNAHSTINAHVLASTSAHILGVLESTHLTSRANRSFFREHGWNLVSSHDTNFHVGVRGDDTATIRILYDSTDPNQYKTMFIHPYTEQPTAFADQKVPFIIAEVAFGRDQNGDEITRAEMPLVRLLVYHVSATRARARPQALKMDMRDLFLLAVQYQVDFLMGDANGAAYRTTNPPEEYYSPGHSVWLQCLSRMMLLHNKILRTPITNQEPGQTEEENIAAAHEDYEMVHELKKLRVMTSLAISFQHLTEITREDMSELRTIAESIQRGEARDYDSIGCMQVDVISWGHVPSSLERRLQDYEEAVLQQCDLVYDMYGRPSYTHRTAQSLSTPEESHYDFVCDVDETLLALPPAAYWLTPQDCDGHAPIKVVLRPIHKRNKRFRSEQAYKRRQERRGRVLDAVHEDQDEEMPEQPGRLVMTDPPEGRDVHMADDDDDDDSWGQWRSPTPERLTDRGTSSSAPSTGWNWSGWTWRDDDATSHRSWRTNDSYR
jgi:hypothetical protein